ncbi:MAG TPA: hypothetical protein VHO71_04895 [Caproiciproducens sp.]|nr:hypothetical protein [Caproiciproducens sp.]
MNFKKIALEFKNSYGSRERDKNILICSLAFGIAALLFLILVSIIKPKDIFDYYFTYYLILIFVLMALLFISFYFYYKKQNCTKYIILKKALSYVSIILFLFAISPVVVIILLLIKLGFVTSIKHIGLYIFPLLISMITIPTVLIYGYTALLNYSYLNATCISLTLALFIFMLTFKFTGFVYFKIVINRNRKHNNDKAISLEAEEKVFYKEIYVFSFVIITLATVIIYCFNFPSSSALSSLEIKDIKDNILYSFAIYLAFDQIHDKWKSANLEPSNKIIL